MAEEDLRKRAAALGLDPAKDLNTSAQAAAVAEASSSTKRLTDLQRMGEALALGLAQSSEIAALGELRFEANAQRSDIEKREKEIAARSRTGDRAQRVIEALREAGSAVVQERLSQIGPILQDVYRESIHTPGFVSLRSWRESFAVKGSYRQW